MKKIYILLSIIVSFISIFSVEAVVDDLNIIVIDPGHGGMDTGAYVGNIMESDLSLEIAKRMKEVFENAGYIVILTREDEGSLCEDKFIKKVDMQKRVNIINKSNARLAISIHLNKFSIEKYRGAQVFYANVNSENEILAKTLQDKLKNYLGNTDRSITERDNVFLLNRVNIPCCLVECGFMSNKEEFELLQNKDYQYKLGKALLIGVNEYLNRS